MIANICFFDVNHGGFFVELLAQAKGDNRAINAHDSACEAQIGKMRYRVADSDVFVGEAWRGLALRKPSIPRGEQFLLVAFMKRLIAMIGVVLIELVGVVFFLVKLSPFELDEAVGFVDIIRAVAVVFKDKSFGHERFELGFVFFRKRMYAKGDILRLIMRNQAFDCSRFIATTNREKEKWGLVGICCFNTKRARDFTELNLARKMPQEKVGERQIGHFWWVFSQIGFDEPPICKGEGLELIQTLPL